MQTITPFLWFDGKAEEAMHFYCSIFENAKVVDVKRAGDAVMSATFQLNGQAFIALNGGPQFSFTPAVSFLINCETQQEVDTLWAKLSDGGSEGQCGWLTDKYGLSWQVVPSALGGLLTNPDAEARNRVVTALRQMKKLDIAALQRASEQAA
jgi:predicted 3-demethylubiquinone-9 3-methyltransferase (glyoxalase superfamily)